MNSLATERSEVDALKDAQKEYQRLSNKKKFFMKKFGIFEHHAKWLQGGSLGRKHHFEGFLALKLLPRLKWTLDMAKGLEDMDLEHLKL
uniref:Uncharacterized protein n=1 Tax=Lactuca sativa TaxID=4236 RepID=A0A9R1V1F6_LACSA|nr:hypothetical protein LSAT_V11C700355820 [Lactuca sativa]